MASIDQQPTSTDVTASARSVPRSLPVILLLYPLIGLWLIQLYYVLWQPLWSLELITGLALASALYGLVLASRLGPTRFNFVVVYGFYLSVSHLGLVASDLLVPGSLQLYLYQKGLPASSVESWYLGTLVKVAIGLSGLGITSFFLGAGFFTFFGRRFKPVVFDAVHIKNPGNQSIFRIGTILLILVTGYFIVMIITGVLPLFATYSEYRSKGIEAPYLPFILVFMSVGFTFLLATGSPSQIRRWIIWFILPAAYLLLIGTRGGVFFALAAGIAVLSSRGLKLKLKELLILLLLMFVIIPVVSKIRNTSVQERDLSKITIDFTDPFIEMGFQLRPLTGTLQWLKNGEAFAYGGTYFLPMQRIIALVIPYMEREPIEGNRFDVQGRTPRQGYSVIAEAYFNFAEWGVVIILAGIGLFLSFANRAATSQALALHGAIMAVLVNNQRNSFIFVPGQMVVILTIFIIARLLENRKQPID